MRVAAWSALLTAILLLAVPPAQAAAPVCTPEQVPTPPGPLCTPPIPGPEDLPNPEDLPVPGGVPNPEDLPAPEDLPIPGGVPNPEDLPVPDDVPSPEDLPIPEDLPVPDEIPDPTAFLPDDLPVPDPTTLIPSPLPFTPLPKPVVAGAAAKEAAKKCPQRDTRLDPLYFALSGIVYGSGLFGPATVRAMDDTYDTDPQRVCRSYAQDLYDQLDHVR